MTTHCLLSQRVRLLIVFCFISALAPVHAGLSDKEKKAAASAALVASKVMKKNTDKPSDKASKLASIEVTGVDSELKKNIELHMPVTIPECHASKAEVKQFFTTVKKHLRKASRALGYYDSVFRSGGKIVNGCWKLRLRITPGNPVKVVKQHYQVLGEGKDEKLFTEALAELPYKKGDVLNHGKYTDFKTRLSEAAQTLGYFDAEFEKHAIIVSPERYQASINLVLNTGKRYRYGKVTVKQKILAPNKMRNYIILKPGQPYSTEDLLRQQQILQRSGYYKLIKVTALHEQAKNNRVPIVIELERKKRNLYTFKVGYGSDTGPRVSAEMNRRWTGSYGKKLNLKAQYSQNLSGIAAQLIVPRTNPDDDSLIYSIKWERDSLKGISNSIELGGQFTRKLESDWIQTAKISYLLDKTQFKNEVANSSNLLLFGVGLEKTKADNILFPNDGWHVKLGLEGAHTVLLSDQTFLQLKASAKRIKSVGKGKILARATLGSTLYGTFDDLPKSLRFYAGGGNSVRGYGYRDLGASNAEGDIIGGRQLLTASLEYQHPVVDQWSAAVFVDAGNAFDQWNEPDLKLGYGVGARWRSPVGPVRIDLGFPEGGSFSDFRLYLNVGSEL